MPVKQDEVTARHLFIIEYICSPKTSSGEKRDYWQVEYRSVLSSLRIKKK